MKTNILSIIIMIIIVVGSGICLTSCMQPTFNGSRVRNPDCYTLDFTKMNMEDSHTLALEEGYVLSVDFGIDKGKADLTIGKDGQDPIYQGNDINSAIFFVNITESGNYKITVNAKKAEGYVHIYAMDGNGGE